MKIILRILLLIATALVIYGYWGAFTNAGNKVYDEMDGYYPFLMLIAGAIIWIIAGIIFFIQQRKKRRIK